MPGDEPFGDVRKSVGVNVQLQTLTDRGQTTSDDDQTGADFDQSFSDLDQRASDRDQRASDRDQRAADRDQKSAEGLQDQGEVAGEWADSRRARAQTTIDRDISAHVRRESAQARDAIAERRDAAADARDANATTRDALVAALDAELTQLEHADFAASANGTLELAEGALADLRRAANARERAALERRAAARDRAAARADRIRAAEDRIEFIAELAREDTDHLTGALRRNGGLEGLRRELERCRRTNQPLTVAFIDVDALKAINDQHGHADGDAVLRDVVACVKRVLRPYDLIIRFGGDEFVCVLCGHNPVSLELRFAQVAAVLAQHRNGASITVGFAQAGAQDSPEQLIARADQAMIAVRRQRTSTA